MYFDPCFFLVSCNSSSGLFSEREPNSTVISLCSSPKCDVYILDQYHILINFSEINSSPDIINYLDPFKGKSEIYSHPLGSGGDSLITHNINSFFFKDKNYSLLKPPHVERIIFLGDSYTFGFGVPDLKCFENIFEEKNSHNNIEVLNFGVFGFNTELELKFLEHKGLQFSPDKVALFVLDNDFNDQIFEDKLHFAFNTELIKKNLSWDEASLIYWNFYKKYIFKKTNSSVLNDRIGKNFEHLSNLSRKNKFEVFIFSFSKSTSFNHLIEISSKQYDFHFFEIGDAMKYKNPYILSEIDTHPSIYAHDKIAIFLDNVFQKFLKSENFKYH